VLAPRVNRTLCIAVAFVVLGTLTAVAQTVPETATPTPVPVVPLRGSSARLSAIRSDLDAATTRALELESQITELEADNRALTERLAVTAARIVDQRAEVRAAEERLMLAQKRYCQRLIEVYKRGSFDPLSLLLTSDTVSELMSRAAILSRIADSDSQIVADLNIAAADARYQEGTLEELQAQDRALKAEQEQRVDSLERMLAEQEKLVAQLTEEAREALLESRRFTAETRQHWKLASIPNGTAIPRATATVDTHPGVAFQVSAYMPRQYTSTGQQFAAVSSWYGPGFNGRNTASGQVFNEDDLTCASRTLPFGTVLALTRGERRVIVYVNDRGPYIAGRDLDLSKAAATALGFSGVATVQAEIVVAAQ
jgi:rare lipoprotein A